MKISYVIPTYNEKDSVPVQVRRIQNVLRKNKLNGEILIIDDSSPDGTAEVVRKLQKKYKNVRLFVRPKKEGVGAAYLFGYVRARGDVIIGIDADGSQNPEYTMDFLKKIGEGYDVVVGSRYIKGSYYERKSKEDKRHYFVSKYGNRFASIWTSVPIHDVFHSFRAIKREVVRHVKTEGKGNSFFMEFVFRANQKGYRVGEIPVSFLKRARGQAKTRLGKESVKAIKALLKLRWS
ncbi:MAG TPA: glycosyltransferase [archaeon]|nr:glycosyltransferase [archaeon]